MSGSLEAARPPWRDEYLPDLPALEQYAKEVAVWQRGSRDRFERADAALWSRVSAADACAIFLQLIELLPIWNATGQLKAAHLAENEARRENGSEPLSMADFRTLTVRAYFRALMNAVLSLGGGASYQQFREVPLGGEI